MPITALTAVIGLSAIAIVVLAGPVGRLHIEDLPHLPWPILAAAFLVTELATVRVPLFRQTIGFTVAEIPLVIGLLLTSPGGLVLAWVTGSAVSELLIRRAPLRKTMFNLASVALQASVAIVVYRAALGQHPPLGPGGWLAAIGAVLVVSVVSSACVVAVVSLAEGQLLGSVRPGDVVAPLVTGVLGACLALLGAIVGSDEPAALVLLLAAGVMVFAVLRAYTILRKRHHGLESLYDFTWRVNAADGPEARVSTILAGVRETLHADVASLFLPGLDGGVVGVELRAGEEPVRRWRPDLGPAMAQLLDGDRSVTVSGGHAEEHVQRLLGPLGTLDALLVPLAGQQGAFGLLAVANHAGSGKAFRPEDRELFGALAGHAGVSIDNDRLLARLREEVAEREYEATHDGLTGLASRALLTDRMGEALAASAPAAALLLIDLDRFKEVNDTLGHLSGDALLAQAAGRLRALLDVGDVVARLGGDEFAVLLPGQVGRAHAVALANQIGRALQAPYDLEEGRVEVAASVGVVVAPTDGSDVATLLKRADVAMYQAKAAGPGVVAVAYDPVHDHHSRRRLSLGGELRSALERADLDVAYQPLARVSDGEVIAAEALVRWSHPELGQVPAEEIIATAERTGLIWMLTRQVLSLALFECSRWRRSGLALRVHVNVSPRTLIDTELVEKVGQLRTQAELPPHALTLEVTESRLVTDLPRSVEVLQRLRDTGVTVALDDFGVGHSSLTYLRRLPCDIIKIDRSFVRGMAENRTDQIIVSSTIALAHSLDLRVVAEGVADAASWSRLRTLGCDMAQGHWVAPALAAEDFGSWVEAWNGHPVRPPGRGLPVPAETRPPANLRT